MMLYIFLLLLLFTGCAGVQRGVIGEASRQGQAFVLTPEQTQEVREMLKGQIECDVGQTAVITAAKQIGDKITGVLRCE